jgi:hypothetical protein
MFDHTNMLRKLLAFIILLTVTVAAEELPFNPLRGIVEVEVTIDGRVTGTFGVDTGADRLYIDRRFAEANGLRVQEGPPQRDIVGIEGSSAAWSLDLRSLEIGSDRLYNLRATAIDMRDLIADQRFGVPDGLIGHAVLRRFYVTVDYAAQTMHLQQTIPEFLDPAVDRIIRFSTIRHLILVDVAIDERKAVPMAVDLCASHTVITPWLAERLELPAVEGRRVRVEALALDDEIRAGNVDAVVKDLGMIKESSRAPIEGILGATFLRHFKLTVDYKRQRLHFHPISDRPSVDSGR